MSRVAIIGGGPAGMMCASEAAHNGHSVTLYERNEKLGKKLFITGKGRCNLTNSADIKDFFENIPRNSRFLYSALYGFTNDELVAAINAEGGRRWNAAAGYSRSPINQATYYARWQTA